LHMFSTFRLEQFDLVCHADENNWQLRWEVRNE
jgi:hypothetical protein